ncbi:MAG: hypothetical protein M3O22_07470 [Pseudomonadota bacterium]|nr:hypothetical protein [Pseudomonadota bacterium]
MTFQTLHTLLRGEPAGGYTPEWLQPLEGHEFARFLGSRFTAGIGDEFSWRRRIFGITRQMREIRKLLEASGDTEKQEILREAALFMLEEMQIKFPTLDTRSSYAWLALGLQGIPGLDIDLQHLKERAETEQRTIWNATKHLPGLPPDKTREAVRQYVDAAVKEENGFFGFADTLLLTCAWTVGLKQMEMDSDSIRQILENLFAKPFDKDCSEEVFAEIPDEVSVISLLPEGPAGIDAAVPAIVQGLKNHTDPEFVDTRARHLLGIMTRSGHRFSDEAADTLLGWMLSDEKTMKEALFYPSFIESLENPACLASPSRLRNAVAEFIEKLRPWENDPNLWHMSAGDFCMTVAFLAVHSRYHFALETLLDYLAERPALTAALGNLSGHRNLWPETRQEYLDKTGLIINEIRTAAEDGRLPFISREKQDSLAVHLSVIMSRRYREEERESGPPEVKPVRPMV